MRETGKTDAKKQGSEREKQAQGNADVTDTDGSASTGTDRVGDANTTVQQLRGMVSEFVDERQWQKFHSPKNLSMALAIEASELMEHFQWLSIDESKSLASDPAKLDAVGEELADVLCYGLALANVLEIDVSDIMRRKMKKNRAKYPVDRFQGNFE